MELDMLKLTHQFQDTKVLTEKKGSLSVNATLSYLNDYGLNSSEREIENLPHPESPAMLNDLHDMHDMEMHDQVMLPNGNMHERMAAEHHTMKMWFHSGCKEVILFDFWRIDSVFGLLASCIVIFIMSATYEGIKWFRVYLQLNREECAQNGCHLKQIESHKGLLDETCQNGVIYKPTTVSSNATSSRRCYWGANSPPILQHFLQGFLYAVQLTFAYWMMLIAMTYNTYLTTAVIAGASFGHWFFSVLKYFDSRADRLDSLATDACH